METRKQLLTAIQARLEHVAARRDFSPVLEPGALTEAQRLTQLAGDDNDLQVLQALGWLRWYRHQALGAGPDRQDLATAVRMFTPCFINGAGPLPEPLLPELAGQAVPAATTMLREMLGSADQVLISATTDLWRRILNAIPADDADRPMCLSNLGIALQTRFGRTGALGDLDAAIETLEAAVKATHAGHPDRPMYLSNLAAVLQNRFGRTGAQADLNAAIEAGQAAVTAAPAGHPSRPLYLSNLGGALTIRFRLTAEMADLGAAIEAIQAAVTAIPAGHPERPGMLSNLGNALRTRFGRTGALDDLDAAIEIYETAARSAPAGSPAWAAVVSNLGNGLQARFERTGDPADLDAAIEACQAAVTATPDGYPSRPTYQSNLGNALQARSRQTGAQADVDAAIETAQAVVDAMPAGHPGRAGDLSRLGAAQLFRFELTGAQADLDTAIETFQAAVNTVPASHPDRPMYLSNLGTALQTRFGRTGALADLDAAAGASRSAVAATPADHPSRAGMLSALGGGAYARFELTGARADLDTAIEAFEAAIQTSPASHPDQAMYLSNLGLALQARFDRTGEQADLDSAIEAGQAAVTATPVGHANRPGRLSNLGNALYDRFQATGARADLDTAIENLETAVQTTPPGHPDAAILSNLGTTAQTRFELTGARADLDTAIENLETAVQATPPGHPDRAAMLSNLGGALRTRLGRTGSPADRESAFSLYALAAEIDEAAPSVRIQAARAAAALALRSQPSRAAGLLENAVQLLPTVAPRQLERSDQQYALGGFAGLSGDAAALALTDTNAASPPPAARALRLLEAGRAVLLSQALDTRSDLTDLQQRHPGLAERFTELRDQLDQPSGKFRPLTGDIAPATDQPGQAAQNRRDTAAEFTTIIEQIRALDGFAFFALPPAAGGLLAQARPGPVVTFNISAYRSDALLLTRDGISSLELPGLAYPNLIEQIESFHQALDTTADPDASSADRRAAQARIGGLLEWLWDSAAEPVLRTLGYHRQPPTDKAWPRVWWAPGGLLGMLPLHAAGYHTTAPGDPDRRTVMDRVISSYTPTIRALSYARQHTPAATAGRSLIVAMPVTPGLPGGAALPNVPAEVARVRALVPDPVILSEPGAGGDDLRKGSSGVPTRASVLAHLPECSIAHFACHGASHPTDPSQSLLVLHDHDRDPLTVASLAPVNLGQAQLAYLSACRTAFTPATELVDEAIHLATAFQLAGFPHVIGTLWEINDDIAVDIAERFYATLRTGSGTLDASQAARALHHAVRIVRDQLPRTPSLWAAYLHAGT